MDEVKWAWVLFLAATVALLVRMAMWFLPSPAVKHSEKVEEAVAVAQAVPDLTESAPAELTAAEEEDPFWTPETGAAEPAPAPGAADGGRPAIAEPEAPPPPENPPPEEFHFRRTRWGMSREEVRASEGEEPLRESDRALVYAVTTLDLPSLLTYVFVQDMLMRSRLSFSDPSGRDIPPLSVAQAQQRFLYLREQLRTRYGEPVQKTTRQPRDVSGLQRTVRKQNELAQQYDTAIAETEQRLKKQRELLEQRFRRWNNREEMVARGLKSYERDLRELREWKQEALSLAEQSRKGIQERKSADSAKPLVATMSAQWPFARGVQDIELRLDYRWGVPRLDIRYEATRGLSGTAGMDEL